MKYLYVKSNDELPPNIAFVESIELKEMVGRIDLKS